jgi:hypothetical protein
MNRTAIVFAVGLALAATLPALPAAAQNTRSFVSGSGSDANPCTPWGRRVAPSPTRLP